MRICTDYSRGLGKFDHMQSDTLDWPTMGAKRVKCIGIRTQLKIVTSDDCAHGSRVAKLASDSRNDGECFAFGFKVDSA